MHEVSLIENVIAMVQQEQAKHTFARVNLIRLKAVSYTHLVKRDSYRIPNGKRRFDKAPIGSDIEAKRPGHKP